MFLILSFDNAFAFYWFSRITLLLLVSYELVRILTKNNKMLSLFGSVLIGFSAAVQWWYCLDPLIWGETILVLFNLFFRKDSKIIKGLIAFGLVCSCLAYIFILYPAWQLTFGYIFIPVFVLILIELYKDNKLKVDVLDVTYICLAIIMIIALVCLWYINSYDEIKASSETVYPGKRIATGGDDVSLFAYFYNMFMPYEAFSTSKFTTNHNYFDFNINKYGNKCENASMMSLYPLPFLLGLIYMFKEKKKDVFLILSIIIGTILSIFAIVGFPEILAKITLLFIAPGNRASVAIGTLCIYVLLYLLGKEEEKEFVLIKNKFVSIIISILLLVICIVQDGNNYIQIWEIIVASLLFILAFFLTCNMHSKLCRKILMILMTVVVLITGLLVNPIQKGLHYLEDDELAIAVREIAKEDPDALWISSDTSFILANFLAANGIKTLNTTNAYPKRQKKFGIDIIIYL